MVLPQGTKEANFWMKNKGRTVTKPTDKENTTTKTCYEKQLSPEI
jgi:hypothetical protein